MAKRLLRVPILLFLKTGKKKSHWQYLTVTNGAWGWSGENMIALKLFWHILSFGSIQLRQIQDGVHLCEEKSNPIGQCVKYEWGWSITQIPEGKLKLSRQKATVQNTNGNKRHTSFTGRLSHTCTQHCWLKNSKQETIKCKNCVLPPKTGTQKITI